MISFPPGEWRRIPWTVPGDSTFQYVVPLFDVALYRLKKSIRAQKLAGILHTPNEQFLPYNMGRLEAGEIVEALSAPNKEGRILIRHSGCCYRVWKEDLRDTQAAERLSVEVFRDQVEHRDR